MTYVYELYMTTSDIREFTRKIYRKNPITEARKEKLIKNYCNYLIEKYDVNGVLWGCNLIEVKE